MDDFKDKLGNVLIVCIAILGMGAAFTAFNVIYCFTIGAFEYRTWNKLHGTNYSWYDWSTGEDFIKKYHYPDRDKTQKLELNHNQN